MSLNRFAFCVVIFAYVGLVRPPGYPAGLGYICGYAVFSAVLFLWIRRARDHVPSRAALALLGDMATISFEMHAGGEASCIFYPIYLWVILGNGFRFGLRFLAAAMVFAIAGFVAVCLTTTFWLDTLYMFWGLLIGLVIVPGYGGKLIAKLSSAREEAEAANRAKSMFLASVSHSVRTPLNAMLGGIGLLKTMPLAREQAELVARLETGSELLMSLVSSILDFTRLDAGQMPMRLQPMDLGGFVLSLRELLAPAAREKRIRLFVHLDRDLPRSIVTDPRHIREILVNLVNNAIKFTASGSVVVGVRTLPLSESRIRIMLSVSDTGIGIEAGAIDRIFDSFTQADGSIIDRFGGTGLGLAIVQRLVRLLGGTVSVESTPGQGSMFQVCLDCDLAVPDQSTAPVPDADRVLYDPVVYAPFAETGLAAGLAEAVAAHGSTPRPVRDAASLARACQQADGQNRPLLILDCPTRESRGSLAAMLAALDPWGDLPRMLVADGLAVQERTALEEQVTAIFAPPIDAAALAAMQRFCPAAPKLVPVTIARARHTLDILVADDNATNRTLFATILERAGHRARLVCDGEQAITALTEGHFDLALIDINMPVMSGLDAAREYGFLSLGQKAVPLVAITADATPETALACREAGMIDCITKPITPEGLLARIEALVEDGRPPVEDVADIRAHPQFRQKAALDPAVLVDLAALGGVDFAAELLDGFVTEAGVIADQLDAAAAAGDVVQFRSLIHAMRSSGGNVGATTLCAICQECQALPASALADAGRIRVRRMKVAIAAVSRAIPRSSAG